MRNSQRPTEVRQYNKSDLPRLRWTPELHEQFAAAVERLGGKYKATPKCIMQMMNVKGLKISHIKSHLQMYRSTKNYDDDDEIISKEQLRAKRRHLSDHGTLPICSPQSQRQLRNGLFIDFECRSDNIKQELAFSEDYRDTHGKRRNEEECGSLDEICGLSLSVTPMEMCQEQEDRESWPVTDGQSQLSTTSIDNNFANYPDCHSLGTNHHLNLDLNI